MKTLTELDQHLKSQGINLTNREVRTEYDASPYPLSSYTTIECVSDLPFDNTPKDDPFNYAMKSIEDDG